MRKLLLLLLFLLLLLIIIINHIILIKLFITFLITLEIKVRKFLLLILEIIIWSSLINWYIIKRLRCCNSVPLVLVLRCQRNLFPRLLILILLNYRIFLSLSLEWVIIYCLFIEILREHVAVELLKSLWNFRIILVLQWITIIINILVGLPLKSFGLQSTITT